jgi:hypothetical protein
MSGAKKVENQWRKQFPNGFPDGQTVGAGTMKSMAKKGLLAGNSSLSVAQMATGTPSVLALTLGGAAASATGIGLVVTGAAATLTLSTLSAVSAHKTLKHCDALDKIDSMRNCYDCRPVLQDKGAENAAAHDKVGGLVLSYILAQKGEKALRKVTGVMPGVGLLETVYAVGRLAYKKYHGTQGAVRNEMAGILAEHLITHNCGLAQAIVAELYSYEQMRWLLFQDYAAVQYCLAEKMKSR